MATDPYIPPRAPVADLDLQSNVRVRPPEIKTAIALVWASIGLGVISSLFDPTVRELYVTAPTIVAAIWIGTFAVIAALLLFVGRGHNWARILFLVLTALGTVIVVVGIGDAFRVWWPSAVLSIVQTLMTFAALYFLFSSPGSQWFRKRS